MDKLIVGTLARLFKSKLRLTACRVAPQPFREIKEKYGLYLDPMFATSLEVLTHAPKRPQRRWIISHLNRHGSKINSEIVALDDLMQQGVKFNALTGRGELVLTSRWFKMRSGLVDHPDFTDTTVAERTHANMKRSLADRDQKWLNEMKLNDLSNPDDTYIGIVYPEEVRQLKLGSIPPKLEEPGERLLDKKEEILSLADLTEIDAKELEKLQEEACIGAQVSKVAEDLLSRRTYATGRDAVNAIKVAIPRRQKPERKLRLWDVNYSEIKSHFLHIKYKPEEKWFNNLNVGIGDESKRESVRYVASLLDTIIAQHPAP